MKKKIFLLFILVIGIMFFKINNIYAEITVEGESNIAEYHRCGSLWNGCLERTGYRYSLVTYNTKTHQTKLVEGYNIYDDYTRTPGYESVNNYNWNNEPGKIGLKDRIMEGGHFLKTILQKIGIDEYTFYNKNNNYYILVEPYFLAYYDKDGPSYSYCGGYEGCYENTTVIGGFAKRIAEFVNNNKNKLNGFTIINHMLPCTLYIPDPNSSYDHYCTVQSKDYLGMYKDTYLYLAINQSDRYGKAIIKATDIKVISCESDFIEISKDSMAERVRLYMKWGKKNLLDLSKTTAEEACDDTTAYNTCATATSFNASCIGGNSSTTSFGANNLSCYNDIYQNSSIIGFCNTGFSIDNSYLNFTDSNKTTFKGKAGQLLFVGKDQDVSTAAKINLNKVCYMYEKKSDNQYTEYTASSSLADSLDSDRYIYIKENNEPYLSFGFNDSDNKLHEDYTSFDLSYSLNSENLDIDKLVLSNNRGNVYSSSVDFYLNFPKVIVDRFTGEFTKSIGVNTDSYRTIGYGIPTRFTKEGAGSAKFSITFNTYDFKKDSKTGVILENQVLLKSNTKEGICNYDIDKEFIGSNSKLRLEFRTIDVSNPFLGKNGNGRYSGQNWSDIELRNKVLNDRNDSHNKKNSDPMYRIVLTPSIIKNIKKYNKDQDHKYDEPLVFKDGAWTNDFLEEYINNRTIIKYNPSWLTP